MATKVQSSENVLWFLQQEARALRIAYVHCHAIMTLPHHQSCWTWQDASCTGQQTLVMTHLA